ncbi:hypothetical protein Tcan_18560 [Toxocara canis]|uniref:Mitochondrial fission factor n=1 Tax=Toxocara canis TaxID=6265 RepID=A0A0B2V2N4_TOXCA|nr:hypothetical protein Tcan_18560 [Toxocara canis]
MEYCCGDRMMHVPHHITVTGDSSGDFSRATRSFVDGGTNLAFKMNVPDRILVAGGDHVLAERGPPAEILADRFPAGYAVTELSSPPDTLTLDKANFADVPDELPASINNFLLQIHLLFSYVHGLRLELSSPPDTLTLDKANFADVPDELPASINSSQAQDESMSAVSIAVEENPLRELKKMRRQLGRLSTRLYQLEDENERRKSRESLLWLSLLTTAGLLFTLLFKRGGFT